jgi:hypothetical protein
MMAGEVSNYWGNGYGGTGNTGSRLCMKSGAAQGFPFGAGGSFFCLSKGKIDSQCRLIRSWLTAGFLMWKACSNSSGFFFSILKSVWGPEILIRQLVYPLLSFCLYFSMTACYAVE